jgi:hypothetical protein
MHLNRSRHGLDSRHCHRCGAVLAEDLEPVPYVGPGPRVVKLRNVLVLRCTRCTKMTIEVPEPRSLDTLIRCLGNAMSGPLPQLAMSRAVGPFCRIGP